MKKGGGGLIKKGLDDTNNSLIYKPKIIYF